MHPVIAHYLQHSVITATDEVVRRAWSETIAHIIDLQRWPEDVPLDPKVRTTVWDLIIAHPSRWSQRCFLLLLSAASPAEQRRRWKQVQSLAETHLDRFLTLCRHLPPALIPDSIETLSAILDHAPTLIRRTVVEIVAPWTHHPDPVIRDRSQAILLRMIAGDHRDPDLGNRVIAAAAFIRSIDTSEPLLPIPLDDLIDACRYPESSVRTAALDLLSHHPIGIMNPSVLEAITAIIRTTPDGDISRRAATLLLRSIPAIDDPQERYRHFDALWQIIIDPTLSPQSRVFLATILRSELSQPVVRDLLRSRIETFIHQIETIPNDAVLLSLFRRPWHPDLAPHILDIAAALAPTWRYTGAAALLGEGWGSIYNDRILAIIRSEPSLRSRSRVWSMIVRDLIALSDDWIRELRTWYHGKSKQEMVYELLDAFSQPISTAADTIPATVLPVIVDTVMKHPARLSVHLARRLWNSDATAASTVLSHVARTASPVHLLDVVQACADGWGRGTDDMIADILMHVAQMMTDERRMEEVSYPIVKQMVRSLSDTILSGFGRADRRVLTTLLPALVTKIPQGERSSFDDRLASAWGHDGDEALVHVVHALAHTNTRSSARRLIALARKGWMCGHDDFLVATVIQTVEHAMQKALSNDHYVSVVQEGIAALMTGWERTRHAQIGAWIEYAIPRLLKQIQDRWNRTDLIVEVGRMIVNGADVLDRQTVDEALRQCAALSYPSLIRGILLWGWGQ